MPGLAPATPPSMSLTAKIFLVVCAAAALLLGILKPAEPGTAAFRVGQHIGGLIVLLGFPLLLSWIVAGRRSARNLNRFSLVFCLASGFFVVLNSVPLLINTEAPDQRFSRLMREAAGLQPESHRGFGRQRRFDDEVRGQYRKLLQLNRDYIAQVDQMDTSKVRTLNAPSGFVDTESEKEGLQQLHALYDADAGQETRIRQVMTDLRQILINNAGSASERDAMLRGFDESMAAQFGKRQQALSSEKAWVDAVDDLHAYAQEHRSALTLTSDGHFLISSPTVLFTFNEKVDFQEQKRKDFLKAQQQFSQSQAESLRKMGLSQKDMRGK